MSGVAGDRGQDSGGGWGGDDDPFDLARFVRAQEGTHDDAVAELRRGHKTTHWMWFVFPQMRGLGRSAMAERYGIASRAEALAYLAHPVLGPRLVADTELLAAFGRPDAERVFGGIDALKLRSSMTLFATVTDEPNPFATVLQRWFAGDADDATLALIG